MTKIPVLLLVLLLSAPAFSQTASGNDVEDQFYRYHRQNYLESVYIHTDKDFYLTGETIHFTIYCLETTTSQPTQLSRVAYADVVDGENKMILSSRIELVNGAGSGEMYIPTTINSGYVILRGYTQWMRNYGPTSFYHSVLTIINPFKKLPPLADETFKNHSVSFFPEGGILLEGVQSRVVFHGKSAMGQPLEFSGKLKDEDGNLITPFEPLKNGLGSFAFVPEPGHQYTAEIQLSETEVIRYHLPSVAETGISLRVSDEAATFDISVVEKSQINQSALSCLVHQGASILLTKEVNATGTGVSFAVPKSQMKAGVFTISLFRNATLVAQRIAYHHAAWPLTTGKFIDKTSHAMREAFSINIDTIANLIATDGANISVSVSEKTPDFLPTSLNMHKWLLLQQASSELFGSASYFEGSDEIVSALINALLIAYPQSTDQWNKPVTKKPQFLPEYRGALATGHIFNKISGEPAPGITAYFSVPGRNTNFFAAISKPDGSLAFELKNLYGENSVVVQTDYTKDSTYRIEIDNPFSKEFLNIAIPAFSLSEQSTAWLLDRSQQMQVINAYQKFNPSRPVITAIDSSAFYHNPDASYQLDDYTRFVVMEEVMREYIAGVNVRKNRDGFHFMVIDIEKNIVYEGNPLMLLDGVPVFDADEIIALDPLKIQKIETVKRRFEKGIVDCEGIVNYNTYKGDLSGYTLRPGTLAFKYDGVQIPKRLPQVKYATTAEMKSRTPDFRTALYWQGRLSADMYKQTTLDGYTSDAKGNYEITINALTDSGKVISIQDGFLVR